jgi:hypothetical protein
LSRTIIDQNLTEYLRDLLPDHDVKHAHEMGWDRQGNGELPTAAEHASFGILLTADRHPALEPDGGPSDRAGDPLDEPVANNPASL